MFLNSRLTPLFKFKIYSQIHKHCETYNNVYKLKIMIRNGKGDGNSNDKGGEVVDLMVVMLQSVWNIHSTSVLYES